MDDGLSMNDIEFIQQCAREKLGECRKNNDVIGVQVFSILGMYARIIFYPLGKNAPWGFTRITGIECEYIPKKPFVTINTSIPIESQIFAAAHELYHIWYENHPKALPSDLLEDVGINRNEKRASRFAAEFLMDEQLLKQEIDRYKMKKMTIKEILQLSDLFMVPYKAMVKRLVEVRKLKEQDYVVFFNESVVSIEVYKKRYGFSQSEANERIVLNNLVELAVAAYEKKYITYEKLEYLLSMNGMTTDELGISCAELYEFPAVDILDDIMEE